VTGQPISWRQSYNNDPAVIYALDRHLKLVHCNEAWDLFARRNDAPELTGIRMLGTCIMDVVPESLTDYYTAVYDAVRRFQRHWWHVFDCSSQNVSRQFQMNILPAGDDGIIVVNTLIREEAHEERLTARIEEYTDAGGIVTMCANCRRAEHLSSPGRWDFVPSLLASSGVLIKPGLCPFCQAYHYPGRRRPAGW
jgi:hypothetical protein